jgi:hypothetical protein
MTADKFSPFVDAIQALVGETPFTILRYRDDGAERLFSSAPEIYAPEGFKNWNEAPSMLEVQGGHSPMLSDGKDALMRNFPDWDVIMGSGCDALVNLLVCDEEGRPLGQINVMGKVGSFTPDILDQMQALADAQAHLF